MLAAAILALHVTIIAFNIAGLIVIPLGAWRGWRFVHAPLWRLAHIASLAVTAVQAMLGQACFLTDWQFAASGEQGEAEPLIMRWVNSLVYWDIPLEVFSLIYIGILAYALALLWLVPLRRGWKVA